MRSLRSRVRLAVARRNRDRLQKQLESTLMKRKRMKSHITRMNEMDDELREIGFDAGIGHASRRRSLRRAVILLALLLAFVQFVGTPHLRMSYIEPDHRGVIMEAGYWGVTGPCTLRAGDVSTTCPLIVLLPLDRSLVSYAGQAIDGLISRWT